jgi:hypothetical protein
VFPQLTRVSYFYKDRTPAAAPIVRAFARSPDIWRQQGEGFFRQLLSYMREHGADGAALISSESMSAHNYFAPPGSRDTKNCIIERRDPFLLAAHLREGQAAARRAGFEELKVIIGIRRQDQYLGSYYAKAGALAETPGQADFERQALEIIDPEKRYFVDGIWLDYKMTRDLVAQAIGENNVLVLPLEQLGNEPSRYFSALYNFIGEPPNLDRVTLERSNFRSVAPDFWRIRESAMKRAARKKPFGTLRAFLARPTEIRLSPALKEKILAIYRDSNQDLAASLDVDLAQYGYCGTPGRKRARP